MATRHHPKTTEFDSKIMKAYCITLTDQEWQALDGDLANHYSNAGCNDLPKEIEEVWTKEEGATLAKDFAYLNNPQEPEGPDWPLPDWGLLALIRNRINQQRNYFVPDKK